MGNILDPANIKENELNKINKLIQIYAGNFAVYYWLVAIFALL